MLNRDASAHDETVNEKNGRATGNESDPVRAVLSYLDAIQREDLTSINAASTRRSLPRHRFQSVEGFAPDPSLPSQRTDGTYATWTFQLVRSDPHGWRISDERWETRLDGKQR